MFLSGVLLAIYSGASIAAALSSTSLSSRALASARNKMIDSFFHANWTVQSGERLGHIQQLLTVNCETAGETATAMAGGLQALLTVVALLAAAFLVSPIAATIVLMLGILLQSALHPFNMWSRRASIQLSEDSHTMATLVTEYTRLTREFRLLGVEREATDGLQQSNEIAARTFRKTRLLAQLSGVTYQTLALAFVVCALAVVAGHTLSNLGAIAAVLLLMLRSMIYGAAIQSTSQQLRSYGGFLDQLKQELQRFSQNPYQTRTGELPTSFDIDVRNVSFAYDGSEPVLRGVSFFVPSGQILGIAGRSGSGKRNLSSRLRHVHFMRSARAPLAPAC
jgi:ABC-type multidrug transport system fused ATPase/permease subunit